MRTPWIAGIVAASLGLSACGATATIHSAINSLGSSADVQINLTASASGPGTAEAEGVLGALSVDMDYTNPTGAPLSSSSAVDSEITVNVGTETLADVRDVDGNAYLLVNVSALSSLPSLNLPASEVSALQLLLGGRWFEFTQSFINAYLPSSSAATSEATKETDAGKQILDALSLLVEKTPYTSLPNGGFAQTGSLEKVVQAVLPTVEGFAGTTLSPGTVKGTYTVTLTTSGTTATGGSLTITTPNGTQGNASVALNATVTHNSVTMSAPSGAIIVTKSLLKELLSQAS